MDFVRKSSLWKNSYFLSNRLCFFHRFADSGFKNKWTGLWHRENKFLEFFAFRERDQWLSEDRCREFSYDGVKAVHRFRIPGNSITQTVFMPETSHLVVELSATRPMKLEFQLAINIRRRFENRTARPYSSRGYSNMMTAWNKIGSLTLKNLSGNLDFQKIHEFREHSLSGEPQNYFTPGRINLSGKKVTLVFTPAINSSSTVPLTDPNEAMKERQRRISGLRKLMRSDNRLLENGFAWSALASEFCRKEGSGLVSWYAGLPWFQQFWGRDVFWVMPSLIALGYLDDVRMTLEYFALLSDNGKIPNQFSDTEGKHTNALDPTLLWVACLEDHVLNSGDLGFLRKMRPSLEASLEYMLSRDSDGDGYVEHDSQFPETWMDTLKRDSKAVDIQALFFRALVSGQGMLPLINGNKELIEKVKSRAGLLRQNLERDFFQNGFFADRFFWRQAIQTRTANALVPLLCGFGKHAREILDAIESESFTSRVGVRTRAEGEPGFDPGGYHAGQAWSLTTSWACAAEFLARRTARGWRYLRMLLSDIERDALGCIGECWDSSSLSLAGCSLQLWGSGFIPRLVDEFMLGIRVNSLDRTISVSPQLPRGVNSVERIRQTGHGPARLSFRRLKNGVNVTCSNRKFRIIRK